MAPPFATAYARTSCSRCHKRKKRCDRALPQCENCHKARIACSFLDDDRQTASYPIGYVRSLESRIQDLETQLAGSPRAPSSAANEEASLADEISCSGQNPEQFPDEFHDELVVIDPDGTCPPAFYSHDGSWGDLEIHPEDTAPRSVRETPHSLDEELKHLSLEATAERHLGSSSGLSFAKLTQMVLRRLTPDKADFVFANDDDEDRTLQQFNAGSPSTMLNNFMFNNFGNPTACDPILFGDYPLSAIAAPDEAVAHLSLLTDDTKVSRLVDFYFAHSHTLYPIIQRSEFTATLHFVRSNPDAPLAQSPLSLFRIWMVLAIGSTAYCSVTLAEESESMLYYDKALTYFEAALEYGDMAALEVIALQVSYSFFNQLGPNTWFLVGLAARIALGMGLHTSKTYEGLPHDVVERRKRVFFSIYMMDRVVSLALGRPFALHEDDIDVSPFADVDEEDVTPDGIQTPTSLNPSMMAVPLHILALRRIAGKMATLVYSNRRVALLDTHEREDILRSLHKELIDWRRNMPFPLPDINAQVPHLTSSWYDFNYYTHLAMLYRPTPLFPTLDQHRIKILAEAASMSIRQATNMHRQKRFAYNWLNLLSVFTSTLSLIYAVTAQPDNLAAVLEETKATSDLELSIELFTALSVKFPAAKKMQRMVDQVVKKYGDLHNKSDGFHSSVG
ncbi:fungal-specific transcription factor domain-containing protein [Ilyonectria robusta]|uniref:fungal-specific transcription factor domain-containing protein n=1 Tax=Ilyonectria robusta TaxID=1079257 RepID=UPI001E8CA5AF|nr:fungal-specific transcription factor domain-containing protein [Ilyonectria robusta]KAH8680268.1 fungal-specific transcription factor domain-containing protein [Ilyonectria robusta]